MRFIAGAARAVMEQAGDGVISNRRYILKERLNHTENWIESFLNVEKHREISKKALRQLNKDKPVLGWIFTIIYLPSVSLIGTSFNKNLLPIPLKPC